MTCPKCGGKKRGALELCSKCTRALRTEQLEKERVEKEQRRTWRLQPPKNYHDADSLDNCMSIIRKEIEAARREDEARDGLKTASPETKLQARQEET